MAIRRGDEYLESLRDGRCVWLMGQRVEDVTTHPALAGCAHSVAAVYDLQHDPAHQELLTMPSPTTGQPVSLSYLLPQSVDDLARQRRMYEFLVRRAGGVAARLPQHLATVVLGLYDVRDLLGTALEAHLSLVSVSQNEDTRRLAAWAAIFAVPTAIAGIYGMNFDFMPELRWRLGYPLVLAGIVGICGLLYVRFKQAKWL